MKSIIKLEIKNNLKKNYYFAMSRQVVLFTGLTGLVARV